MSSKSQSKAALELTKKPPKIAPALAKLAELEAVFGALAHEQRRHILLTLHFRGGELGAGAIAERFACSWPTTSRHLRVLMKAGLVTAKRLGRERIYRLERNLLLRVAGGWLDGFEAPEDDQPRVA